MLELLLLRHAKSSWGDAGLADHDRDLSARGEKAARRLGRLLRGAGPVPDLVLTSTARRTTRTAALVVGRLQAPPPVKELKTLYLAAPALMLDIIRRQAGDIRRLMVVAHNPGMHALALRLTGSAEAADRDRLEEKFPTATLAVLRFDVAAWGEVAEASGRLAAYHRPSEGGCAG